MLQVRGDLDLREKALDTVRRRAARAGPHIMRVCTQLRYVWVKEARVALSPWWATASTSDCRPARSLFCGTPSPAGAGREQARAHVECPRFAFPPEKSHVIAATFLSD
jgi:hypothetical protein